MDKTILYYKTTKGDSFIIVDKETVIDRVQSIENDKDFIKWKMDSIFQIELLKSSLKL